VELSASIALDGVPMNGDSIYITLPAGTSFVSGSYTAGANAPAGPPQTIGQLLRLPLPTNLPANAVLTFTFSVRYDDPAGCADKIVSLQTREKTQAVCGATVCDVYVATSEALLNLNAQNPELQLTNFQIQQTGGQSTFSANLENVGSTSASNPVVEVYHDQNGNGQIDPSDPLVATINHNGTVTSGATVGLNGNINLNSAAYCDLIALIPADENCACSDKIFPLGGNQVVTEGIGLCIVQPVTVGTDSIPGNIYTWLTTDGLSCTNCANAIFNPGSNVQSGALITLVLQEKAGDCTIERRFDIQFGGNFGIESTTQTVCQGTSATLEATAGGLSYQWSGPGITNPNQQTQIVTPLGNSVYQVTVTFTGGCTGTGSVVVNVNPSSNKTSTLTTCEGVPVQVFSDLTTDQPGSYTKTYLGFNGCDSVVTVNLVVPNGQSESTVTICKGDSIIIAGTVFKEPGVKCVDLASSSGCDSTHCTTVLVVDNPDIAPVDSVILQLGEEITLDGPNGFNNYEWTPPGDLSCADCEDPVATPDTSTTFILVVKDGNGCRDTVGYRVFICDVDKYLRDIPNAFTPNNDDANDVFKPVPNEGAEMIVSVIIYDRWGAKVYEGFGNSAGWDGTIKGKPAPSDVYVYIVTAECSGVQKKKTGEVTLIR
ncbi:MAG: gliding motility-associated C-terminal domain-containing protein, partial [Saprospiraceae bacterium]|nr:gliding motility-associated C-terminal domain-containing protein [Saprospiraceae bacterium]